VSLPRGFDEIPVDSRHLGEGAEIGHDDGGEFVAVFEAQVEGFGGALPPPEE